MKANSLADHATLMTSVLMLSTAPVLVKFLTIEPIVILFWRLLIVSFLLLPFAYKELGKMTKKDFKNILVASCIFFVHFLSWFSGVQMLDIGVTAVTFASNPIFTAIIGFLVLREAFKKRYFVAICASILGIYTAYFSNGKTDSTPQGIILILIAALCYSAYMVYSKRNRATLSNGVYTFYLNFFTCILGLIALVFSALTTNVSIVPPDIRSWFFLFLLAFIPSILGHTLMIFSLPKYNLNFVSCLKLISPLSASLLAVYLFEEPITENLILGFVLVSTGVLFALPWSKLKRTKIKPTLNPS